MTKTAFIFPGQGSQRVGMLSDLIEQHTVIQTTFATASEVLGYDLWALALNGPAEKLNQTAFTQPALLAADISLWRIWQQYDVQPTLLAGHSLGEYAALVAADVLGFEDAIHIVSKRGEFMQQAVPAGQGAMAAIIGLEDEVVATVCHEAAADEVLSPANYNAIGQVVIAGSQAAVDRALPLAKAAGAKLARLIPVSVPSHCALMKPAALQLTEVLQSVEFKSPNIPVIHNVDALQHDDPESIRQALISQLDQPVRWVASMQAMVAQGITQLIECGPGNVLTGLMKRIDKTVTLLDFNHFE